MDKQEKIEVLQDWVRKNSLTHDKNLKDACKLNSESGEPIDWFDDVLAPIGWNCCDRCGALGESELDFVWVDYLDEQEDKQLLDNIAKEKVEYCALCWNCVKELKK